MVTGKAFPHQRRAAIERPLKVSCVVGIPSHDAAKQHGIDEWARIREWVVGNARNRSRETRRGRVDAWVITRRRFHAPVIRRRGSEMVERDDRLTIRAE